MFEFFKHMEKQAFLLPSEEDKREAEQKARKLCPYEKFKKESEKAGKDGSPEAYERFIKALTKNLLDPFRLAHEGSSFTAHRENIPFLLKKEQLYRQKEEKEPVFGCKIKVQIDGFYEGGKFYATGGKEKIIVLKVLSDSEIGELSKQIDSLSFEEAIKFARQKEDNPVIAKWLAGTALQEACLKEKSFFVQSSYEVMEGVIELLCMSQRKESKESVAWELTLLAVGGNYYAKLEGIEFAEIEAC